MVPRRPMTSRYQQIFLGNGYSCNNFGHKTMNCKAYENFHVFKNNTPKQQNNYMKTKSSHQISSLINFFRRYENENSHNKQKYQRFYKSKNKLFGYCHYYHKFGHKVVDCRTRVKDKSLRRKQDTNTSNDRRLVSRVPRGHTWRRNLDYKDSEETQISNISGVSKDNVEHNSVIDKNEIHYQGKQDEYVKEYVDEDEDDEEEYSDDCGCLF